MIERDESLLDALLATICFVLCITLIVGCGVMLS